NDFSINHLVGTYRGIIYFDDSLYVGHRGGEEGLFIQHRTSECVIEVSQIDTDSITVFISPFNTHGRTISMQDDLYYSDVIDHYYGIRTYELSFSEFPHDSLTIESKTLYDSDYKNGFENVTYRVSR